MKSTLQNKSRSTTEALFSEYLNSSNNAILEQLNRYKKIADIYERTQIALGRKAAFKSTSSSTEKVKINLYIGATNKI